MPRTYLIAVVRRSIGFWIGLRLLLTMVTVLMMATGGTADFGVIAPTEPQPVLLPLVVILLLFDARAAGEDLLLANFGVSRLQLGVAASLAPAALESLLVLAALVLG